MKFLEALFPYKQHYVVRDFISYFETFLVWSVRSFFISVAGPEMAHPVAWQEDGCDQHWCKSWDPKAKTFLFKHLWYEFAAPNVYEDKDELPTR